MKRCLWVLLVLLLPGEVHAELRTYLEPRLVDEMDSVRLTLRADGTGRTESPDLEPLMADFEVLGSQTSSRITTINGRSSATVDYQITLRPKRTGEITLPRLEVGGEFSAPLQLVVRPLDPGIKETIENMVFFETELSRNPVYVQAETVLVRKLYYSTGVQIYSDLPGLPEIEKTVVVPLGDTQSRSVLRGGQRYGVIEQRFAIFPEQSGTLTIPAISVTSSVRLQSGGRTRRSGIRVSTESIDLAVLPIPASYPADVPWLPATEVTLEQQWDPMVPAVEVGDPLSFRLDTPVRGNRGSAIPPTPLPLPPDQFKVYPEAPQMDEDAVTSTVIGTRRERYALIPTAPGLVDVMPVTLTWWDTEANRVRQTSTRINPLTITGLPTPPPTAQTPAASEPQSSPAAGPETPPWLFRLLIALGVTATALALGLVVARLLIPLLPERFSAGIRSRRRRQIGLRQRLKALQAAAAGGNPAVFRQALIEYLRTALDAPAHRALERLREHPEGARALVALDAALYGSTATQAAFDPLPLVVIAREVARQSSTGDSDAALPALYA